MARTACAKVLGLEGAVELGCVAGVERVRKRRGAGMAGRAAV